MIRSFIHSYKLRRFYSNLIGKENLCFDVGANIGVKSKIFLKTGAKVIAFEPQKECIPSLSKIKSQYANFNFHPVAIGTTDGIKKLHISNYSEIATFSNTFISICKEYNIKWLAQRNVKTISINTAIRQFGLPHFCKIDIEGYEFEVLSILQYNIPLIEFEITAGFKDKAMNLIKILNNQSTLYNYTLNEQPFFQLNSWVDIEQIYRLITELPDNKFHANVFIKNINTN